MTSGPPYPLVDVLIRDVVDNLAANSMESGTTCDIVANLRDLKMGERDRRRVIQISQ